jgi:hypothetical protein
MPGLNVYFGPLKISACASHNAGREMVWNNGPVNEYEAQSEIIHFVSLIIMRKEHELRQQGHLIFISQCVATKKEI